MASDRDVVADAHEAGLLHARPDAEREPFRRVKGTAVRRERGERVEIRSAARRVDRRDGAAANVALGNDDRTADMDLAPDPRILDVRSDPGDAEEHPEPAWVDRSVGLRSLGERIERRDREQRHGPALVGAVDAAAVAIEPNEPDRLAGEPR